MGRGNYERMYQLGLSRKDFDSDETFRKALEKFSGRSRRYKAAFYVNELKSAPCSDCKQTFDPVCMDFDHLPEFKKKYDIARMTAKGLSIQRIGEEIKKCELVCSNCHRLRTKKRWLAESEVVSHEPS